MFPHQLLFALENFMATHHKHHMPALQVALTILGASAWQHLNFNEHIHQDLVSLAPRSAPQIPTAPLKWNRLQLHCGDRYF